MPDRQQLQEYYRSLSDDDLARIALTTELAPEAREVIGQELQVRGLKNLSSFKRQMEEDAGDKSSSIQRSLLADEQKWKLVEAINCYGGVGRQRMGLAVTLPMGILAMDRSESLGSKLQVVGLLGAIMALSVSLGLQARRRGRRLAFYLRAVVTLALLCTSTAYVLVSRCAAS